MNMITVKAPTVTPPPPVNHKSRNLIANIYADVRERPEYTPAVEDLLQRAMIKLDPAARAYPRLPPSPQGMTVENVHSHSNRNKLKGHRTRALAHAALANHPDGLTINELSNIIDITSKPLRFHIKALLDDGSIKPAGIRHAARVYVSAKPPADAPDPHTHRFDTRFPQVVAAITGTHRPTSEVAAITGLTIYAAQECLLALFRTGRATRVRRKGFYHYTAAQEAAE